MTDTAPNDNTAVASAVSIHEIAGGVDGTVSPQIDG